MGDINSKEAVDNERKFQQLHEEYKRRVKANPQDAYKDPDFPADESSLFIPGGPNQADLKPVGDYVKTGQVKWLRPREICDMNKSSKAPKLVEGGAQMADVNQGFLGDCWFLAGIAHLGNRPEWFRRVVPFGDQDFEDNYSGLFRFRFWRFGQLVTSYVDDRIPCIVVPDAPVQPVFVKNVRQPNEFWVCLLEKAYAKATGTYEDLSGSIGPTSLIDLTGGIGYTIALGGDSECEEGADVTMFVKSDYEKEKFFRAVKQAQELNTMMICGTRAVLDKKYTDLGICHGHMYSVLRTEAFRDVKGNQHRLIQLRNPHGTFTASKDVPNAGTEWRGDWSDNSDKWKLVDERQRRDLLKKDTEGIFWISMDDFVNCYQTVAMCFVPPIKGKAAGKSSKYQKEWNVFQETFTMTKTQSDSGPYSGKETKKEYWNNPQFVRDVKDVDAGDDDNSAALIVSVMTVGIRKVFIKSMNEAYANTFDILKVSDDFQGRLTKENCAKYVKTCVVNSPSQNEIRENRVWTRVAPGRYVIIPYAVDLEIFDDAKFLLRIFTEAPGDAARIHDGGAAMGEFVYFQENVAAGLFQKYAGSDRVLDAHELQHLLNDALAKALQQSRNHSLELETCRFLLAVFDEDGKGRLDLAETIKLSDQVSDLKEKFLIYDVDASGFINAYELKKLFAIFKIKFSDEVMVAILKKYSNKKGTLSFSDFVHVMTRALKYGDIAAQFSMANLLTEDSADEFKALTPSSTPFKTMTFDQFMCNVMMY